MLSAGQILRIELSTPVKIKIIGFWDAKVCSFVESYVLDQPVISVLGRPFDTEDTMQQFPPKKLLPI
jgi:hypothetical protein